jgi:hypothetical protein
MVRMVDVGCGALFMVGWMWSMLTTPCIQTVMYVPNSDRSKSSCPVRIFTYIGLGAGWEVVSTHRMTIQLHVITRLHVPGENLSNVPYMRIALLSLEA